MDDDGNMTYFYPNGTQITDQSLINKIKRTDEFKTEKDRMQREHNQEILDKVIEHNKTNNPKKTLIAFFMMLSLTFNYCIQNNCSLAVISFRLI